MLEPNVGPSTLEYSITCSGIARVELHRFILRGPAAAQCSRSGARGPHVAADSAESGERARARSAELAERGPGARGGAQARYEPQRRTRRLLTY